MRIEIWMTYFCVHTVMVRSIPELHVSCSSPSGYSSKGLLTGYLKLIFVVFK